MAIRLIVKHPDDVLRERAKEVTKFNANLHKLLDDMADTMYDADGVGLAAPQVGISKRVIVVDADEEHGLIELVNPEIVSKEGEQLGPEGCLSIPGLQGDVRRAQKVTIRGQDRHGNPVEYTGTDLLARAFQHEVDHLDGVLFIDLAESVYERKAAPEQDGE
ncbi:peptide deformylase [Cohnella xylanilytica]|uniref:Peptide deformylase n=1 Tax=Cohnella xylanilytica TaxID=557555 RepID=A0A841U520_9BACL|nr:peptide deformylase [Cohnella xylanilytica]MBB6693104.1 peptide deformylase [Cohnella xylanilytica]GIO10742.1 peptide deformylase [Cohnella xylanilytica]